MAGVLRARLSRRIAFWIFLNFLVVEAIVLVPSVLRQAERLSEQLRAVTNGKVEWLLATGVGSSTAALLTGVKQLQDPAMLQGIEGAALYRQSSGALLGAFGQPPRLSSAEALRSGARGRWFPLLGTYDAVWTSSSLGGDHLLVIRHDAAGLREGLLGYILNICLIVLGIAAFLTLITMLVMHRLVIGRILDLRDHLREAGLALGAGGVIEPARHLMPAGRDDEVGDVEQAFNQSVLRTSAEMGRRQEAERSAQCERDRAEGLLLNILPAPIAEQMKQGQLTIAETHPQVSVLFADIVGFTELSGRLSCHALVDLLNRVFTAFDQLSDRHGVEKIKTIGDNYMVVGGLPTPTPGQTEAIAAMALDMRRVIAAVSTPFGEPLRLRIGIHAGPVVAGVIGTHKFIYDLWGETVNIASRMESSGLPGRIQVSTPVCDQLRGSYVLEARGLVPIKGVGPMATFWLEGPRDPAPPSGG